MRISFQKYKRINIINRCYHNQLLFNIAISNMQYINPLTRYSKLTTNEEKKNLIMKANYELENMQMRRFISHKKRRSWNMYNTSLSFKSTSSLCTWGGGIKRSWKQLISKLALNTRINAQQYKRRSRHRNISFSRTCIL